MFKRFISSLVCITFVVSTSQYVYAQPAISSLAGGFSIDQLPVPGSLVGPSVPFVPLALKGLIVNPHKPLEFQFIVDTGKGPQDTASIKDQSTELIKYFLAGLTIPEGDLWVNLSPYEKDRIVPTALGQTELGRDLLAQDYILKQLTASLIYPEKDLGKEFWSSVYKKALAQFGTTNVPVNTFNKVWILPDQVQIFENGNAAYVTKATLKVMLDQDYLSLKKHNYLPKNDMSSVGANIVRTIILPEIKNEVNTGKNFAPLRQIYQALILAKWYKQTIQNGLLDAVYMNKSKVAGVDLKNPAVKEQIYQRYLQAYKKGVFNYIKEDPSPNGQVMPKKYFSGGVLAMPRDRDIERVHGFVKIPPASGAMLVLTVDIVHAAGKFLHAALTPVLGVAAVASGLTLYGIYHASSVIPTYLRSSQVTDRIHGLILLGYPLVPALMFFPNLQKSKNTHFERKLKWYMAMNRFYTRWNDKKGIQPEYTEIFDEMVNDRSPDIAVQVKKTVEDLTKKEKLASDDIERIAKSFAEEFTTLAFLEKTLGSKVVKNPKYVNQLVAAIDKYKNDNFILEYLLCLAGDIQYQEGSDRIVEAVLSLLPTFPDAQEYLRTAAVRALRNKYRSGVVEALIGIIESSRTSLVIGDTNGKAATIDECLNTLGSIAFHFQSIWDEVFPVGATTVNTRQVDLLILKLREIYPTVKKDNRAVVHQSAAMWAIENPIETSIQSPGGIDLNQINLSRTGKKVKVQFDAAQLNELEQGRFDGFTPKIIGMKSILSPLPLLGVNLAKETGMTKV